MIGALVLFSQGNVTIWSCDHSKTVKILKFLKDLIPAFIRKMFNITYISVNSLSVDVFDVLSCQLFTQAAD